MLEYDEVGAAPEIYDAEGRRDARQEFYAKVDDALARQNVEEAARIARQASAVDEDGKVRRSLALAKVSCAKKDAKAAKRHAEEAFSLARAMGERSLEAAALHRLAKAMLLGAEAEPARARQQAQQALEIFRSLGDKLGEASVLTTLAKAHLPADREQAQSLANDGSHMFKLQNEKRGQAAALHVLFSIMLQQGRLHNALILINEMSRLYKLARDQPNLSTCALLTSEVQRASNNYSSAMASASECHDMAEELGDEKKKAAAVYMMSNIMESSSKAVGASQQANETAYASWTTMRNLRDKLGMAASLEVLAKCHAKNGEFKIAVQKLEEATNLCRHAKDVAMEAHMIGMLCEVMLHDPKKNMTEDEELDLVRYAMTAVELHKQLGEAGKAGCIGALIRAATAYHRIEPSGQNAIRRLREAIKLSQELGARGSELTALVALAKYQLGATLKPDAIATAEQAMALAEKLGDDAKQKAAQDIADEANGVLKKSTAPAQAGMGPKTMAYILRSRDPPKPHLTFDVTELEARIAQHMTKGASSSSASAGEAESAIQLPSNEEVLYDVQWKSVTKDLISLPASIEEIVASRA